MRKLLDRQVDKQNENLKTIIPGVMQSLVKCVMKIKNYKNKELEKMTSIKGFYWKEAASEAWLDQFRCTYANYCFYIR